MNNQEAKNKADYVMQQIIKEQPNFLAPNALNADSGKAVGEFIAAFRSRLIEMYENADRR